ncbi:MAG: archease [Planctomycetes bacterium]|nr:archease [Planctomycetota bacterium]
MGIELSSDTLRGLYATAGRALFLLMAPHAKKPTIRRAIESDGADRETLLANFLNDLLYEFEAEGLLIREIAITNLSRLRLHAELFCENYDPLRTEIETVVKAVTWHGLEIQKTGKGWRGVVYLDL